MKLDKESTIGIVICAVLLFAWTIYQDNVNQAKSPYKDKTAQVADISSAQVAEPNLAQVADISSAQVAEKAPAQVAKSETAQVANLEALSNISLINSDIEVVINPNEGIVDSVTLLKYKNNDREKNITIGKNYSFKAFDIPELKTYKLENSKIIESDATSVVIERIYLYNEQKFSITQIFILKQDYILTNSLTVKNLSSETLSIPALSISSGLISKLTDLCGDKDPRMENFVADYSLLDSTVNKVELELEEGELTKLQKQIEPVKWISVGNKYFASILLAGEKEIFISSSASRIKQSIEATGTKMAQSLDLISTNGVVQGFKLQTGESKSLEYSLFAGPKELKLLEKVADNADKIMHLAWLTVLEWISIKLLSFLTLLTTSLSISYGMSIILLTVIIKMLFWPITQKANSSMKKMQTVQPKMKELREKYKDNSALLNTEMMKLYKEEKVNPLGGCFPILFQIPVFFALFSTLSGAVELRQVPFLWSPDLTGPDTLFYIFGLPFNPLVLTMTATMFLQQKLTPTGGDPMQQKMMMFMPLIMLFFCYNFPSGLTVYWNINQIISIIQLLVNKKIDSKGNTDKVIDITATSV